MKFRILALVTALVTLLSACGGGNDVVDPTPSAKPTPAPVQSAQPTPDITPEPTPTPYSGPVNPLTGLPMDEEDITARPVAVMINNAKQAMPQLGISQADIIYEAHVEYGITRMLALFQSVDDVGVIGSVRSARADFLEIVAGHDAVLLHAGGSQEAYDIIDSGKITSFDCVRTAMLDAMFWRDPARLATMDLEHTLVTSGEKIRNYLPTANVRLSHQDGFEYSMQYTADGTPAEGQKATKITVPFSHYKTGVFTYDSSSGKYLVEQYGAAQMDDNTDEQLAVTNVLVLRTTVTVIDSAGHVAMDLTEGDGWYACGGKLIPIAWSKDSFDGQFVYKTADGECLTLGAGNSYVNIIPIENKITVE